MRVDDYIAATIAATKLSWKAQAVFWRIGAHVNRRTGETFVGAPTLAREVQHPLRSVQEALAELRAAAVFDVIARPGRSNIIRFPLSTPLRDPALVNNPHPCEIPHPPLRDSAPTPARSRTHNHVRNPVGKQNRAPAELAADTEAADTTPAWFKDRHPAAQIDGRPVVDVPVPRMMWDVDWDRAAGG
jgi:hypothetical protein